jgi:NADPH2:quinone reductase
MTAHRALTVHEHGPTRLSPGALAGRTVLVQGGAGAVGHAAVQLAVWAGATVIASVSSEAKEALARAAGAHHVVRYPSDTLAADILAVAPDGVDHVVEVSPGTNAALDVEVLANHGSVGYYANDGGPTSPPRSSRASPRTSAGRACCSTRSAPSPCATPPRTSPPPCTTAHCRSARTPGCR